MRTVKELRELIDSKQLTENDLKGFVKQLAENIDKMDLGSLMGFKNYIRVGAEFLDIDLEDLNRVYNSFRK